MYYAYYSKLLGIAVIGCVLFIGCSSDDNVGPSDDNIGPPDDPSESSSALIYDKWWYESGIGADLFFASSGEYRQLFRVAGTGRELTATANWAWEDVAAGIIKLTELEGEAQPFSEAWFKVSDLKEHTVTIQQSTDGVNYSSEFFYRDTE